MGTCGVLTNHPHNSGRVLVVRVCKENEGSKGKVDDECKIWRKEVPQIGRFRRQ